MTLGNLGPLPKGDRNDDLQQLSLVALRHALPTDLFLFRDERVDDKGVDGALELKHDHDFLNIRSQFQLKGTDNQVLLADGTYSHPIKVSNLNYLLNGLCPLYVVWIAPRNELRFVWARDEARRLHRENPKWTSQDHVNLRFMHILSGDAIQGIFDRILQEGRMLRQQHDTLAKATVNEPVIFGVNPQSLCITNPDEIHELMSNSGLSLVSAGYAAEVLGVFPFLNPAQIAEPRIRLVRAYAHMSRGDYLSSGGDLAHCMLAMEGFSAIDQHFLLTLRNAFDYHTGRIDHLEYLDREKNLGKQAPLEFALQHELEACRLEHLSTRDADLRRIIWQKLCETVTKIGADVHASLGLKLKARLVKLFAATLETGSQFIHRLIRLAMQKSMGFDMATPAVARDLREILDLYKPLMEESDRLLKETVDQQYALLYAEALITQACIVIDKTRNSKFFLISSKLEIAPIPDEFFSLVRQRLEEAVNVFARASYLELEIWAKLFLADWLEIAGDTIGAQRIAKEVRGSAFAMGYEKQLLRANDHISGKTEYLKLVSVLSTERDMDAVMAEASDDQIKKFAADGLEAMNLPQDRLKVVERECMSLRDIAREQIQWCRHLELIQDLRHSQSPLTHYLRDPSRMCSCAKFKYRSNIENPDWEALIVAFKRVYCAECSAREPKQRSENAPSTVS